MKLNYEYVKKMESRSERKNKARIQRNIERVINIIFNLRHEKFFVRNYYTCA